MKILTFLILCLLWSSHTLVSQIEEPILPEESLEVPPVLEAPIKLPDESTEDEWFQDQIELRRDQEQQRRRNEEKRLREERRERMKRQKELQRKRDEERRRLEQQRREDEQKKLWERRRREDRLRYEENLRNQRRHL
jgi:hypothetical protein